MQTTKDKILDATISYIKQEPNLSQVSISDIATKADIGKSTVYEYFENKNALIEEAYSYLLDKYQRILLIDINDKDFKNALMDQLSRILDVMEDVKGIMEVIMNAHSEMSFLRYDQCSIKIQIIQDKMTERFNHIFSIGVESGEIHPSNRPYANHIVQALISGLMFQYVDNKIDIKRDALIKLIYQEMIRIIES
jgi:AcrR family transcriptional regulator